MNNKKVYANGSAGLNAAEQLSTTAADVERQYSLLSMPWSHKTTFDSGKVVPIFNQEVVPGDNFKINFASVMRLAAMKSAVMDAPIVDFHAFFVPTRIANGGFINAIGDNGLTTNGSSVINPGQYKLKTLTFVNSPKQWEAYKPGDLATYLGYPIGKKPSDVLALSLTHFSSYALICNRFYKNEAYDINLDATYSGFNIPTNYKNSQNVFSYPNNLKSVLYGYGLYEAQKLPDYFTTLLPTQQRGESAYIDLDFDKLKVVEKYSLPWKTTEINLRPYDFNREPITGAAGDTYMPAFSYDGSNNVNGRVKSTSADNVKIGYWYARLGVAPVDGFKGYSLNDLRNSIATQHDRELTARTGNRYNEYIKARFGVEAYKYNQNQPEFLAGFRHIFNMSTITQTSTTDIKGSISPLGNIGIVGLDHKKNGTITYSASEYGNIYIMCVVRSELTYSQGLDSYWTRDDINEFYSPVFANISEQPVYLSELNFTDMESQKKVIGYNQAWERYRVNLNRASGYVATKAENSVNNLFCYSGDTDITTAVGSDFMRYNSEIIGNTTILNGSEYINQFIGDFAFDVKVERNIPIFSIPGIERI